MFDTNSLCYTTPAKRGKSVQVWGFVLAAFWATCACANFQPVNLNVASKEQLMVLPGVGEKLAQRIIEHRTENGHFASLDDLLLIKGLRPKLLTELSGKIEISRVKKVGNTAKADIPIKEAPKGRTDADIQKLLASFDNEPKAREVQEKALHYATAEPERVDEWLRRARIAPAFPSLVVSAGKGIDSNASVRGKVGDANVVSKRDASDFNVHVKLEWKFSELLFNRNELYVAREAFRMGVIRERILHDVIKTYTERRKAQLKSLTSDTMTPVERAELNLYIEELTAVLDGLTGGWFGEKISKL
jgi:hypothetical protein